MKALVRKICPTVADTPTPAHNNYNSPPRTAPLAPGRDADIVVWDPQKTRTISKETHHQNIDFNIYEGMETVGNPAITLSRGRVVWEKDQLHTERGTGRYIERPPFAPYWASQEKRNLLAEPKGVERVLPKV